MHPRVCMSNHVQHVWAKLFGYRVRLSPSLEYITHVATCCVHDESWPCWCSIKWMQAMQRSLLWAHSRRKIVGTSTTTLVYGWTFNAWTHWWLRPCGRFRRRDSGICMRAYCSRSLSSTTPASLPVVVRTACAVLVCAPPTTNIFLNIGMRRSKPVQSSLHVLEDETN